MKQFEDDLIAIIKQAEFNGFNLDNFCTEHNISVIGNYKEIVEYLNRDNLIDILLLNEGFLKGIFGSEKHIEKCKKCNGEGVVTTYARNSMFARYAQLERMRVPCQECKGTGIVSYSFEWKYTQILFLDFDKDSKIVYLNCFRED